MKILVGMSGGVDSSVSAALLQQQGFEVVGGFIKNWSDSKDLWTGECQWRGERRDALRVAAKLGIDLITFDFEKIYRESVVEELFKSYEVGETPNPDVLCNEAIKFGIFFNEARRLGFDAIATGHYARVYKDENDQAHLLRGLDENKDQSYFLYRISQEALRRTFFPVGDLPKRRVRELAKEFHLPVANKPDSQGICFIGKLDMGEFLRKKIPSHPGDIVDPGGVVIGHHDGLDLYTIGQRHNIRIPSGQAWYVAKKDKQANRLIVAPENHPLLFQDQASIHNLSWIGAAPASLPCSVEVQVRYRQAPVTVILDQTIDMNVYRLRFSEPVKAVAAGQSAVLYHQDECLGGGILFEAPGF